MFCLVVPRGADHLVQRSTANLCTEFGVKFYPLVTSRIRSPLTLVDPQTRTYAVTLLVISKKTYVGFGT